LILRILKANSVAGYAVREENLAGRRYYVVPMVAIVEGVHSGLAGTYYYPAAEIVATAGAWNNVPLPVGHPLDDDGTIHSISDGDYLQRLSIGFASAMRAENGRLVGEAWIDVERAEAVPGGNDVLAAIEARQPLEVSTSMYADATGEPGVWQGERYEAALTNYRPDHIAILPGAVGACSISDGCGIRSNKNKENVVMIFNVKSSARTPTFEGTESSSWANVNKSFGAYRDAYYAGHGGMPEEPATSVADCPAAMKRWIASKTLLGDAGADNERDLMMFPVVNPKTGKLNEGALRAVLGGRGLAADIPATAKESAQNKARALLNRHFGTELETNEEPSMVKKITNAVAKVVSSILGNEASFDDIGMQLRQWADKQDTPEKINWVEDTYEGWFVHHVTVRDPITGNRVASKLYRRTYNVDENGQVTIGDEAIEVIQKKEYVPVESPAGNEVLPEQNQDRLTIKNKEINAMEKKQIIDALIACECTRFQESDREFLSGLSEAQLERLKAPENVIVKLADPPAPAAAANAQAAPAKPQTAQEYIDSAPTEIRSVLQRAVNAEKLAKTGITEKLLANKNCGFTKEELESKPLDELQALAQLAQVEIPDPDYSGQAGNVRVGEKRGAPKMPQVTMPEAAAK